MKLTKTLIAIAALVCTVNVGRAQTTSVTTTTTTTEPSESRWHWNWNETFTYTTEVEKFRANEFSFDFFGSYNRSSAKVNDFFDEPEHGDWGGGVGVNYFFLKWLGVGIDSSMHADGGTFVDNVSGSMILRLPIDSASMAPSIFGGGGRYFNADEWAVHAGAGIEFRLNPHTGIFIDGRYVWADKSSDSSQIRSGLRFAF